MLEFAEKLTFTLGQLNEADVEGLRQVGFSEKEILGIVLASSYRNFITRVADMLGVELTDADRAPEEFLEAFGVTREQARTTMYGQPVLK